MKVDPSRWASSDISIQMIREDMKSQFSGAEIKQVYLHHFCSDLDAYDIYTIFGLWTMLKDIHERNLEVEGSKTEIIRVEFLKNLAHY